MYFNLVGYTALYSFSLISFVFILFCVGSHTDGKLKVSRRCQSFRLGTMCTNCLVHKLDHCAETMR